MKAVGRGLVQFTGGRVPAPTLACKPAMVAHACNLSTWKERQIHQKFKAVLHTSLRPA